MLHATSELLRAVSRVVEASEGEYATMSAAEEGSPAREQFGGDFLLPATPESRTVERLSHPRVAEDHAVEPYVHMPDVQAATSVLISALPGSDHSSSRRVLSEKERTTQQVSTLQRGLLSPRDTFFDEPRKKSPHSRHQMRIYAIVLLCSLLFLPFFAYLHFGDDPSLKRDTVEADGGTGTGAEDVPFRRWSFGTMEATISDLREAGKGRVDDWVLREDQESSRLLVYLAAISQIFALSGDVIIGQLSMQGKHDFPHSTIAVFIVATILSILFSNVISFACEGIDGVKQSWDFSNMWCYLVPAICFKINVTLKLLALGLGLQPDQVTVLGRPTILFVALGMAIIYRQKPSKQRWGQLLSIMLASLLFIRLKDQLKEEEVGVESWNALGVLAVLGAGFSDMLGSITEYIAFNRHPHQCLYVQMTHMDFPGLLMFLLFATQDPKIKESGFFGGFTMWSWVLVATLVWRQWTAVYLVKIFGPMLKQLLNSAGLMVCYLLCVLLFPEKPDNRFDINVFLSCVLLALATTLYAISE